MSKPTLPSQFFPTTDWPAYPVWERVQALCFALPNYFQTELIIKGINVTEVFSVGSALATVVETQVVSILNKLRNLWDPDHEYSKYAFVRQSQTFPEVLLRNLQTETDILFGIEIKAWYVFSKEGEPSFRYQVTPEACAPPDLLVILPWLLSEVISGTPRLLTPYVESAKYAAQYQNDYWRKSRLERGEPAVIRKPPAVNCHPYPSSKQEASDAAEGDKGGNFGRIARAGILDDYLSRIKAQDYLGVKIAHWITFFKAISETSTEAQIDKKLQLFKTQVQTSLGECEPPMRDDQRAFLEILERFEGLWKRRL